MYNNISISPNLLLVLFKKLIHRHLAMYNTVMLDISHTPYVVTKELCCLCPNYFTIFTLFTM